MKVLVFSSLFPNNIWPNHGVFVKERIRELGQLGTCEINVIAPVPYYPSVGFGWRAGYTKVLRQQILDGILVYHPRYFMIPKVGMLLHGWTMFLSLLPFVSKLRRTFDFDLLDAHYLYPDGFAAVLLGAVLHKPVIVSARGSDVNEFNAFPLIRRMLRWTVNSSAHSIAVCQALKDAMIDLQISPSKISVIPNGVDTKKFFPSPMDEARRVLGLPSGRRIILSVGALIPRKGHRHTIGALKPLIEKHGCRDVLLLLVGSGPQRQELQTLVRSLDLEQYVRFVGEIPHDQLHWWYSAADVFCLASDREGWPNAIMESLACGTPVVATDVWGIPEIIQSRSIGVLTGRDEEQIAAALQEALATAWDRELIVQFASGNTWNAAAQSIQSVFESVLKLHCKRHLSQFGTHKRNPEDPAQP